MRNLFVKRLAFFVAALCWPAVGRSLGIARVFVSVNGNDGNVCSNVATPCRTFGGGITQVDPGGEVIVLDTGSYGGTTITKAVTINVPPGVVAFAAQPFIINAGGSDIVTLRGITLKALTPGTGAGLIFSTGAALHLVGCVINGWATGISSGPAASRLIVEDSIIKGCTTLGVDVEGGASASFERTRFEANPGTGLYVAFGGAGASARDCVFTGNGTGAMSEVINTTSFINLDSCLVSDNTTGVFATNGGGSGLATLRLSNCTVTRNTTGTSSGGGNILSRNNNTIQDNGTDTSGGIGIYFAN